MRLTYLHGPPASGKLTLATELTAQTGAALLDNHVTIDVARVVVPFGTPSFWTLVAELRRTLVHAAAVAGTDLVVTSCYDHPADLPRFEELERTVHDTGGTVVSVYLRAPVTELERRVASPDRAARGKLTSVAGLRRFLDDHSCLPVPRDDVVTLDVAGRTPADLVDDLLTQLDLPGRLP